MNIPDIHDFDPAVAAKEFLKLGFTAVDDIGGLLYKHVYKHAEEELFEELGFAADAIDIATNRIDTDWGPVCI